MILKKSALLGSVVFVAVLSGCTALIRPEVKEAGFPDVAPKESGRIELYVTEDFLNQRDFINTDSFALKWLHRRNLKVPFGLLAADTLYYSLRSRFEHVNVNLGTPSYPLTADGSYDVMIAVEPAYVSNLVRIPFLMSGTSVMNVDFNMKVYDQSGKTLIDGDYQGVGETVGFEQRSQDSVVDIISIVASLAMKDVANQLALDVLAVVDEMSE